MQNVVLIFISGVEQAGFEMFFSPSYVYIVFLKQDMLPQTKTKIRQIFYFCIKLI